MIYTFICDPDKCDTMIEVHVVELHDFPSGKVQMTCPCGRSMQYISLTKRDAA
jgi:hypothetical protein